MTNDFHYHLQPKDLYKSRLLSLDNEPLYIYFIGDDNK